MGKACSHCASMDHSSSMCLTNNASTLVSPGFKLFGVHLDSSAADTSAMKKSCSVKCFSASSSPSSRTLSNVSLAENPSNFTTEYLSDHLTRHPRNIKKGVSWTEDEHRKFLAGLEKLGKGDWKGISKHFVQSRTPTQVASHAQKYFLKQNILSKNKEMPSLFSMQTENLKKGILNAPRNTHHSSKALWLKYVNRYYSDAFFRKSSYSQSPMRSLLISSWLYNSKSLSTYPKSNYHTKPAIGEAEPNLELALGYAAPQQLDSRTYGFLRTESSTM